MATIAMTLKNKPEGFDKDENPKTSSILKPIKYAIIGMTVLGGVYGAKELIKNLKKPNPNETNKINNVVKADSTAKTNIDPDTVANYNDVNKKTPKFELLGGDNGELLIDRSTYKISCINCLPDKELDETLALLNSTKITDVNKYTVVAAFMWIEDNLPEDQQLNNKIAVLIEYGTDEGTITNKGEGPNPFRYDYDKVDPNIKSITNWFATKNASPLSFITRLCNDYGLPIETTVDKTDNTDDLGLGDLDLGDEEANVELDKKNAELDKELADAKARVEKSFKDKKKSNEELLQEIQNFYKTTGKNPAEEFDWYEEWAKENNITQEDLDSK